MALTKVTGDFIKAGSITQGHLHSSHGITTSHIAEGDKLFFTNARVDSRIGSLSSSDLSEGTNLYYTDARVDARIAAADTGDLSEGSNLYYTQARFDTAFTAKSTSDLSEGTNLYFTNARADARIAAASTSDLSEGTNLYYTDARADARITAANTDSLSEGSTNLYYTDARADARVALIVDSAPGTLNTLNELAAALGDDANFATTTANSIGTKWTQDNAKITNWDTAYGWGNHASAGYLTSFTETNVFLGSGGSASTHPGTSRLIYSGQVSQGAGVLGMPTINNANAFINLNKHSGEYNSQLGFSSDGHIYYRNFNNTAINSTQTWHKVYTENVFTVASVLNSNVTLATLGYTGATNANYITNNNQLTNGAAYITASGTSADSNLLDGTDWGSAASRRKLGLSALTTEDRSTYSASSAYHTGVMGWGAVDFNTLLGRGSGFFDTWSSPGNQPSTETTHWNGHQVLHYSDSSNHHYGYQMAVGAGNPAYCYIRGWWANGGSGSGWAKMYNSHNLTLAVLGYTGATNANYITNNNQLTNGAGYTTYTSNQALYTNSSPTFTELYANSWFRNNNSGQGLYNQATSNHWYSDGQYWNVGYSGTTGIRLRNGHAGTILGYLYAETSGQFGLLDKDGAWVFRTDGTTETELRADNIIGLKVNSSGNTHVMGNLTIGNTTSSDLYFTDTDGTTRRMHCNSNLVGFLNSGYAWGAYCSNNGDWTTDFISYAGQSMRAPIFYDSANTAQFIDPGGSTSRILGFLKIGNSSTYNTDDGGWGTRLQVASTIHARIDVAQDANAMRSTWYCHTGNAGSYFGTSTGHHQYLMSHNAVRQTLFSGYSQEEASYRAPIFYDSNNTAYYTDPTGQSSMYGVAVRGDLSSTATGNQIFFWGGGNSTTSAIGFKANGGYFTNPTGNGDGYNTYLTMDTAGRGWVFRQGTGSANFTSLYNSGWILNNGVWQANASMRAPVFYDSNNTGYYVDPADGNIAASFSGGIHMTGNYGVGITGLYTSTRIQTIFNMGAAYKISNDGASTANAYGLYWSHQNAGSLGGANNLASHGIIILEAGGYKGSWGGGRLVTPGDIRGTIFYDYNNSGYYVDPDSSSNIVNLTVANTISGSITRTAGTSGYGHPGTGMWPFYNWGGSNGGGSAPTGSSYTTGISIGSHPGDQAYGWQMANNMWNAGIWYRTYNSGFSSWYKLLDNTTNTQTINSSLYVNSDIGIGFTSGSIGGKLNIKLGAANQIAVKNNFNGHSGVTGLLHYTSASYASSGYNMVFQAAPPSGSDVNMLLCYINGNLVNRFNSYGQYSDIKLKENIVDTTPKLEDVKRIRIRNFNFKGDPYKQIGVVAQELEEVFPGLVEDKEVPDEEGTTKTVKYSVLVPILVKAMQEQQTIIDDLKSRLETLENQ